MVFYLQEEVDQAIVEIVIDFEICPSFLEEQHPGCTPEGLDIALDIIGHILGDSFSEEAFTAYPTNQSIH
jgi:hypothetical protein